MNYLTSLAQQGGVVQTLVIVGYVLVFGVIIYFLMIRPERKRRKEEQKLRDNIQIGDEIMTIGDIHGKIVSIKEDTYVIETIDHSKLMIAKNAIQTNLTVHE